MIDGRRLLFLTMALAASFVTGCAANAPAPVVEVASPVVEAKPAEPSREAQAIATVDVENSLFFDSGVTDIDTVGMAKLRQHAERLKADPKLRVKLIGYTDDLGSRSYNLAIAEKRVLSAYEALREFGVRPRQLQRQSVGGEKARKGCLSPECRSLMRRVELVYQQ